MTVHFRPFHVTLRAPSVFSLQLSLEFYGVRGVNDNEMISAVPEKMLRSSRLAASRFPDI